MRQTLPGVMLGILFLVGHGLVIVGTALESLDGPGTATVAAVKISAKAMKAAPKATAKTVVAIGKAIH